jgi:molecular chaperone GrpE
MKQDKSPETPVEDLSVEFEALRKRVGELEAEVGVRNAQTEEYRNMLLRHQADFENHIKRTATEKKELQMLASKDVVVKLLDVLDTLDSALKTKPKDAGDNKIIDGMRRVRNQLWSILSSEGLEEIKSEGHFDHGMHEVVDVVCDIGKPDGTICDIVQKGYKLNGRVIRTTKVVVVKNRGEEDGKSNRD